uniref:Uncharacterized protein n=1 Tax=Periophthalmus magnuspinnatus TaxID=409849 RepID=A0A3B3ZY03_9GOBI
FLAVGSFGRATKWPALEKWSTIPRMTFQLELAYYSTAEVNLFDHTTKVMCLEAHGDKLRKIAVHEEATARLHFIKFENAYIETSLDFIKVHFVITETISFLIYKRYTFIVYLFVSIAVTFTPDISPYSTAGRTFWGLGAICLQRFDELLQLASIGQHCNIMWFWREGLSHYRGPVDSYVIYLYFILEFSKEDMASSLLHIISRDIGVYFGGFFIWGHPVTMHTITCSINSFTKARDIGAFMKEAEEDTKAKIY